jgi:uncharacterized protein YcfJ
MKTRIVAIAVASIFTAAAAPAIAQGLAQDRGASYYSQDDYREGYRSRDDRYRERDRRGDNARVIDSRPVYATESREECWNPRAGHFEEVRGPEKTRIGKGAVIGGVAGGVLGHQVGGGRGKDVATVAGAAGGAYAGHQIEKNQKSTTSYQVNVNMDDGSNRAFVFGSPTSYKVGDKVKIVNKKLVRQ